MKQQVRRNDLIDKIKMVKQYAIVSLTRGNDGKRIMGTNNALITCQLLSIVAVSLFASATRISYGLAFIMSIMRLWCIFWLDIVYLALSGENYVHKGEERH